MVLRRSVENVKPRSKSPLAKAGIAPGLYHYLHESEGAFVRFHLRVDATGNGLLLANASAAARLRCSGVIIAKGVLEGDDEATLAKRLRASFRGVTSEQAAADVRRVREVIAELDTPSDNYPILNLADPTYGPEEVPLDRPLSVDLPLGSPHAIRPILDRLWELAIPHAILIVDKAPDEQSLVGAVEHAEDLGLITGVRGRGSDLADGTLIYDLAIAGLDHLDVACLSAVDEVHNALLGAGDHPKAVKALLTAKKHDVCPVAEMALTKPTMETLEETLEAIVARGVTNAAFFAVATEQDDPSGGALHADELIQAAGLIEEAAEQYGVRLLWYPTVRFDPALGLARQVARGPRSSGDSSVRIELDGSVIPARGPYRAAGNLLSDDWETIRRSDVFQDYCRRAEADDHCNDCPGLIVRAADCPRNPSRWADAGKDQG